MTDASDFTGHVIVISGVVGEDYVPLYVPRLQRAISDILKEAAPKTKWKASHQTHHLIRVTLSVDPPEGD